MRLFVLVIYGLYLIQFTCPPYDRLRPGPVCEPDQALVVEDLRFNSRLLCPVPVVIYITPAVDIASPSLPDADFIRRYSPMHDWPSSGPVIERQYSNCVRTSPTGLFLRLTPRLIYYSVVSAPVNVRLLMTMPSLQRR